MTRLYNSLSENVIWNISALWISVDSNYVYEWYWKLEGDGSFSIASAYKSQFSALPSPSYSWNWIWELPCPSKQRLLIFRVIHNSLPTKSLLCNRSLMNNSTCFRCNLQDETLLHALRDCDSSKGLWLELNSMAVTSDFFALDLHSWLSVNCKSRIVFLNIPWKIIFVYAVWLSWFWRNSSLFDASEC